MSTEANFTHVQPWKSLRTERVFLQLHSGFGLCLVLFCCWLFFFLLFFEMEFSVFILNQSKKSLAVTIPWGLGNVGFYLFSASFWEHWQDLITVMRGSRLPTAHFQSQGEHMKFWKLFFIWISTGFIINFPFKSLSTHHDSHFQRNPNASKASATSSF